LTKTWFIGGYKNIIFVSSSINSNLYVYENNLLIKTISTQCKFPFSSFLFDNYNHILVVCFESLVYIYHVNGTYAGRSMETCQKPMFANFDSKNRLVIICKNEIRIYH
jgi:hypothetical protein